MTTPNPPRPGQFFLAQTGGPAGAAIRVGQLLIGDASRYTHAGIALGDGTAYEARPSRSGITRLSTALPACGGPVYSNLPLTDTQAARVVDEARNRVGRPYSWATYAAIGLNHWGIRPAWLRNYITNSGRAICTADVDDIYLTCGIHLFDDGRWPHDVTPGDLANRALETDWAAEAETWEP
jgi:hypothetical protein